MEKRTAPEWKVPVSKAKVDLPPLKLYNSLSNSKVSLLDDLIVSVCRFLLFPKKEKM